MASAHGRGPICEWPGHRLQGGKWGRVTGQVHSWTDGLFITEVGAAGLRVLLLLPRQLRKCLFPFRKSSIYFLP